MLCTAFLCLSDRLMLLLYTVTLSLCLLLKLNDDDDDDGSIAISRTEHFGRIRRHYVVCGYHHFVSCLKVLFLVCMFLSYSGRTLQTRCRHMTSTSINFMHHQQWCRQMKSDNRKKNHSQFTTISIQNRFSTQLYRDKYWSCFFLN